MCTVRCLARARSVMRPSVVGVNKSGRPVVYHPPPPLLLPSGKQRPPLLLPSNQLLQLNPAMGRKRSRQNKNGQSRDRNSSYSSNDRMAVNGQTSRKRKAGRSADSGRQKKRERREDWIVCCSLCCSFCLCFVLSCILCCMCVVLCCFCVVLSEEDFSKPSS